MQTIKSPAVSKVKPEKRTLCMGLYSSQPKEIEPTKNYFRAANKKQCNKCNVVLISKTNIAPGYLKRHQYVCRACRATMQKKYFSSLLEQARSNRKVHYHKDLLKTIWRKFLLSIPPLEAKAKTKIL